MNIDVIEQRLVDLEMRLAFQEQALQDLSDALAAARDGDELGRIGGEFAPFQGFHRGGHHQKPVGESQADGLFSQVQAQKPGIRSKAQAVHFHHRHP